MKYYLAKVVRGVTYYYNVNNEKWEGLKDNATIFYSEIKMDMVAYRHRLSDVVKIPVT